MNSHCLTSIIIDTVRRFRVTLHIILETLFPTGYEVLNISRVLLLSCSRSFPSIFRRTACSSYTPRASHHSLLGIFQPSFLFAYIFASVTSWDPPTFLALWFIFAFLLRVPFMNFLHLQEQNYPTFKDGFFDQLRSLQPERYLLQHGWCHLNLCCGA
jgi:hypothetical protein